MPRRLVDFFTAARSTDGSRRRFVRGMAAAGAVAGLPLAGCGGGSDDAGRPVVFTHGVASGDPLADRVILWTRVRPLDPADTADVNVRWLIAEDSGFTRVAARGEAAARADADFTVKVDATGLNAGTRYWFRFEAGELKSFVGRTSTLPSGRVTRARLAVFSCANYPTGFFNAYADAARRAELGELDVAVHLGDYLYEYGPDGYASDDAAALGRVVQPARETVSLADYRQRYAQYRNDGDLQRLHGVLPMIAVWDDHEITNDTWKDGAENHQSATEGSFSARRAAALQAFHEWMPIRTGADRAQIWRGFEFGDLLSLHMLDTRVAARDQQLDYANYIGATGFDATAFGTAMADPARQLLGTTQQAWLQQRLGTSTATWQVLGQQVLMARMNIPAPILFEATNPGTGLSVSAYGALAQRAATNPASLTAQEQAILAQPSIPYNLDAWDGYAVARETVLQTARTLDRNLVVLAGDTHNAWASDLRTLSGQQVGVEFATSSVTSPGFEEYLPSENPAVLAAGLTQLIEPLQWCDTSRRGYLIVTATPQACRADWVFVNAIDSRSYVSSVGRSLQVLPGAANRKIVEV
jgi:alkaline phosphatase D